MEDLTGIQNDIIDFALEGFHASMVIAGQISWNLIESDLNNLVVGFNGKPDPENYFNQTVKDNLIGQSIQAGKDSVNYDNALNDLKSSLDKLWFETEAYYTANFGELERPYLSMSKGLVTTMKNDIDKELGATAYEEKVLKPAQNAFSNHMNEGSTKAAIITDMQHRIEDRFYSFSVTTAGTIMQQFVRRLNDIFGRYFQLVWVKYEGPNDAITRDFCEDRLEGSEGGYYHIEEVKQWPNMYAPWDGMIPNTDAGSIFVNGGGYNCRHNYLYVKAADVPEQNKIRAIEKGYTIQ